MPDQEEGGELSWDERRGGHYGGRLGRGRRDKERQEHLHLTPLGPLISSSVVVTARQ